MARETPAGETVKADLSDLKDSLEHSPGVYEVMRLYAQYEKVLAQALAYMPGCAPNGVGFSSSDRTG